MTAERKSSDGALRRPFRGSLDAFRRAIREGDDRGAPVKPFGDYQVCELLGSGGMGTVYRAVRTDGLVVALKVARSDRADQKTLRRRLQNEAAALQALDHPNIVKFVESGEVDGVFFLATEFIEGPDLLTWSRRHAPKAHEAMEVAVSLADALYACHREHVLHRDLSPSNVVMDPDGRPILVDFGLGIDLERPPQYAGLTKTDHVAGKYAYLPPEATDGASANERWDIYAFGGCLYAMVTAQEFDPRQLHDLYPSLSSKDDASMRKLKLIARKCLAKRPEHRFASAERIKEQLQHALNPPPRWRGLALTGIALALVLGLFALAQLAGRPSDSPIRFWSHGLHLGLVSLFFLRARWMRHHGDHVLELSRFMPLVWFAFMVYYVFNMWSTHTSPTGPWVSYADAMISNATGVAMIFAFLALWLPTRRTNSPHERAPHRWAAGGVIAAWVVLGGLGLWGTSGETAVIQTVLLPSSLFVGASLCAMAIGLGQKTLHAPAAALIVLVVYGLVQLFYPAFPWIAQQGEGWLIAVYGFGMIGKLALFIAVESILRTWSLFGYEGQLTHEW